MPQWSVLGPFLLLNFTSEMFELVENRLFAFADYSTLLAVVRKPADRPAADASPRTWSAITGMVFQSLVHGTELKKN